MVVSKERQRRTVRQVFPPDLKEWRGQEETGVAHPSTHGSAGSARAGILADGGLRDLAPGSLDESRRGATYTRSCVSSCLTSALNGGSRERTRQRSLLCNKLRFLRRLVRLLTRSGFRLG
jgi:hypothetical protein